MAKDFAFLFYVNDWAGGTQWMSRLQRGGYLDLLLYQVNNTSFSLEEIKNILGSDFDLIWDGISSKFKQENGKYFNEKMKLVLEARANFTESRRNNRVGKTKKTSVNRKKNTRKTLVKQVGNEKEKEIGNKNELEIVFDKWIEMRKNMKDGITENAIQLGKDKLKKLSGGDMQTAIEIINESLLNSWKGFFPLKNNNGKQVRKGQPDTAEAMAWADSILSGENNP